MMALFASGEQRSCGEGRVGKGIRNEDDLNQWSSKYELGNPGILRTLLMSSAGQHYYIRILRCHLSFLLMLFCEHIIVNRGIDGGMTS